MILWRTTPTSFQSVFEMTIFRNFDSKWDENLLSMTQIPSDDILEGLYKLRIRESEKLKMELHNMEIHQKKAGPFYRTLKTMSARSMGPPRRAINRRRRTREGPEPTCVQTPSSLRLPWYRLVGVAKTSSESHKEGELGCPQG